MKKVIIFLSALVFTNTLLAGETSLVWVFFTDKGFTTKSGYDQTLKLARDNLTVETARRRARVLPQRDLVGFKDIPVCYAYVEEIERLGGHHRVSSSWLNCASFKISTSRLEDVRSLPFVKEIADVAVYTKRVQYPESRGLRPGSTKGPQYFEYGLSSTQLNMLGIPEAHSKGLTGAGVRIGILDSGFEVRHVAFQRLNLLAEYDFLSGERLRFEQMSTPVNYYHVDHIDSWEDSPGDIHVVFEVIDSSRNQEVYYTNTSDWGSSWSIPVNVSNTQDGYSAYPSILSSGDSVLVAWQDDWYGHTINEEVVVWSSTDDAVVNVSDDSPASLWPSLSRTPGYFHIAWASQDLLKHGRSSDGLIWDTRTATALPNVLSGLLLGSNGDSSLFAAVTDNAHRLWFVESTDEGLTWSEDTLSGDAELPDMAITDGRIDLIYKNREDFPLHNITYLYRDAGGWSEPVDLFTEPRAAIGELSIASSQDSVWVAYEDRGYVSVIAWGAGGLPSPGLAVDTLTPNGFCYSPELTRTGRTLWKCCGDDTTRNQLGDHEKQHEHGTAMLSVIGGYQSGQLIGCAFNAEFILGKTEKISTAQGDPFEYDVEEDWWVKGLEWAEGLGVDIISSSLGYRLVPYAELDGNTAVTTRAADIAASYGVLVVNAVGNRYYHEITSPHDWLVAPADGDSVLAAGATDEYGAYDNIAAYGPLVDGRDKPDVATLHIARVAHPGRTQGAELPDSFQSSGGTSNSTALIAGMCGLILEAHPSSSNHDVRTAVMRTSSLAQTVDPDTIVFGQTPSDSMGWGVPSVMAALDYLGDWEVFPFQTDSILPPCPNPFVVGEHSDIWFRYVLINDATPIFRIYTLSGRLVEEIVGEPSMPGRYVDMETSSPWRGVRWDPQDLASGVYIVHFSTGFGDSVQKFAVVR